MWQNETAKKIHWLWHHAWFLFFLPFHSPLNQWGDMLLLASSTYKCSFNIILCIISVYRWIILIILKALHSILDLLHMMLLNIQTNQIKPFEIYCVFWLKWTSVNWINFKRKKKTLLYLSNTISPLIRFVERSNRDSSAGHHQRWFIFLNFTPDLLDQKRRQLLVFRMRVNETTVIFYSFFLSMTR